VRVHALTDDSATIGGSETTSRGAAATQVPVYRSTLPRIAREVASGGAA
jgi:hypothetical protein